MNDDPFGDPAIAGTVDRVRGVLSSDQIRPEFSRRLRAELVAAASAQIDARRRVEAGAGPVAGGMAVVRPLVPRASALPQTGPLTGPITGPLTGPLTGPITGPLTGGLSVAGEAGVPTGAPTAGGPSAAAATGSRADALATRRRSRRRPRRHLVTWASAAAAAAAIVVGTVPSLLRPDAVPVKASSALTGVVSADLGTSIRLTFDRDVNHASVQSALRIVPAALVTTTWQGNTMTVTPVHGLSPASVYRVTVAAHTARTAAGAPLAADLLLAFGTAPAAGDAAGTGAASSPAGGASGPAGAGTPAALKRTAAATAGASSEAVVTRSGAMLVSDGRATGAAGLLRVAGPGTPAAAPQRLGTAADSICVSRSGRSVVSVSHTGGTTVVFADATGTPERTVPAAVDPGSPLGWIDDDEVTFVSGGRVRAMDRQGRQRMLSPKAVDLARQSVVFAPGGRYAYLGDTATSGQVVDLVTGSARRLTALATDPAFTADGAGVVWADTVGGRVRLHHGPSRGGPETTAILPVAATQSVSGLGVVPDGTRFVYSVSGGSASGAPGGAAPAGTPGAAPAQLRLAALPSGVTLAASDAGGGRSPKFSPTGRWFTVLAQSPGGHRIETVDLPGDGSAAGAVATAFATAQVGADPGAQAWLARAGTSLPAVPTGIRVSRADVVRVTPADDGTVAVTVRLTDDGQTGRPWPVQAEETVSVTPAGAGGAGGTGSAVPKVTAVRLSPFAASPAGPQVLHVVTATASDGTAPQVAMTFDGDLDPASVPAAVRVTRPDGSRLPATARYDAATRTVVVSLPGAARGTVVRLAVNGVRDVSGAAMAPVTFDTRV